MTKNTTATVETLTAQVRALIVGSRQVTMSVYNQLDHVEPNQVEPFGRVRPRDARDGWIYLIGRHESGTLVRASLPASESAVNGALRGSIREPQWRRLLSRAEQNDNKAELEEQCAAGWRDDPCLSHAVNRAETEAADLRAKSIILIREAEALREQYESEVAELRQAAAPFLELPLIVLAGLR